jgi:ribosome maturation factor RimP
LREEGLGKIMKNNGSKNIASAVKELILPTANEMGYYLWDVEFVKEGADKYLRITIDNEDGITIEDCEKFHRAIDPVLDEADPISESYILEVSSPGIERELKCAEHIEACEGWDVEIKLYAPKNGSKSFRGVLSGYAENGDIVIECGEEKLFFNPEEAAKISTYFDFGNI